MSRHASGFSWTRPLRASATLALARADVCDKLLAQGMEPAPDTPAQYAAHIAAETVKWSKLIRETGMRAD